MMQDREKTKEQLIKELARIRRRHALLERTKGKRTSTEKALKESEDKAQTLINATTDFVTLIDPEGRILAVNDEVCKSVNKPRAELIGACIYDFEDMLPPPLVEFRRQCVRQVVLSRNPIALEDKFNGRDLDIRIHPVTDRRGKVRQIAVFSRDITERKRSERKLVDYQKRLRELTSQLTLAEEKERRRIATDIHDRIGQSLSLSYIKLGALRESLKGYGCDKDVDGIRELIEQTIEDTHSLTFELYPSFLFELGFEKALECLAEEIQMQYGLCTVFTGDNKCKILDEDVLILLFRTVRELLVNTIKHARAQKAEISVTRKGNNIHIAVRDDGVGFDPAAVMQRKGAKGGFGLLSIKERLSFLGGTFFIESEPLRGTKITLAVPLSAQQGKRWLRRRNGG